MFFLLLSCIFYVFLSYYLSLEPCRDPDLCKHFTANQPDTSPCSQCVSGHLWGEVINVVTVCAAVPGGGEDGVCMCVSSGYVCGVDEVTGFSVQLVAFACICLFFTVYTWVCACAKSTDSQTVHRTNGQASALIVSGHIRKQMPGRTTMHANFFKVTMPQWLAFV